MKIVWFVNMPPNAFSLLNNHRGQNYQGWIAGLADAVLKNCPEIELSIAFESNSDTIERINGISYYAFTCGKDTLCETVAKTVNQINPDIIHLHGSEGKYPALPISTWGGKPVCMSLQGIINGYSPHYMAGLHESELKQCSYFIKRLVLSFLRINHESTMEQADYWRINRSNDERIAFQNIPNVFGRTTWDRAWTKYLNPNARYFTVGEVLRAPFYSGLRSANNVIRHSIYASACLTYPLKGGHWLLRAVAALKNKYPDIKLHIADSIGVAMPRQRLRHYFHGDYAIYLRNLIRQFDLEENIVFLPSLNAEEVASRLSSAEVFCLPSTAENSPNSLGEASMLGVPIVATDVGGVSSLVEHNHEAILVPAADPAALADAIDTLFSNKTLANELSTAAYQKAIKLYDPSVVANQLRAAYSSILLHQITLETS